MVSKSSCTASNLPFSISAILTENQSGVPQGEESAAVPPKLSQCFPLIFGSGTVNFPFGLAQLLSKEARENADLKEPDADEEEEAKSDDKDEKASADEDEKIFTSIEPKTRNNGKPVIILVADRMCSGHNCRDFGNFHQEWKLQLKEGRITAHQFDERMDLLDSTRQLVPKPAEYEAKLDEWSLPPKIQLMGRDREEIGIALGGHARTAAEFAWELKQKRNRPSRHTIHSVAQSLEQAHRNTIRENFGGVNQGEIIQYAADARNIYGVKIGRSKTNEQGQKVPDDPEVQTFRSNLFSTGANGAALRHLAPRFGYPNLPAKQTSQMKTYRLEEAKQHVIEAMRLNVEDAASKGTFSVSENFDAYIFTPGEKAVYWEHEPAAMDPRIQARLEREVPPIETMKKLMRKGLLSDDIPGRFQMTEQQKKWRDIAMGELATERELEVRSRRGNSPESTYIWSTGRGTMRQRKPSPRRIGRESMQSPNRKRSNPPNKNIFNKHANRRKMRDKKKLGLNSPRIITKRARG